MPAYPTIVFNTIPEWENYVNTNIVANGAELITGPIGNNAYNGAVKFVKQSPLNWSKAAIYSAGGDIALTNFFLGVACFITTTPDSLTWSDNFYNEYVLINQTNQSIPLAGLLVYYNLNGDPIDFIPANSAVVIFKAENDLWIATQIGSGAGSTQKQPDSYKVGTTVGAPVAGASTWTLPAFANSYVCLFIGNTLVPFRDFGVGLPYQKAKSGLSSSTIEVGNYTWNDGDELSYILITP